MLFLHDVVWGNWLRLGRLGGGLRVQRQSLRSAADLGPEAGTRHEALDVASGGGRRTVSELVAAEALLAKLDTKILVTSSRALLSAEGERHVVAVVDEVGQDAARDAVLVAALVSVVEDGSRYRSRRGVVVDVEAHPGAARLGGVA